MATGSVRSEHCIYHCVYLYRNASWVVYPIRVGLCMKLTQLSILKELCFLNLTGSCYTFVTQSSTNQNSKQINVPKRSAAKCAQASHDWFNKFLIGRESGARVLNQSLSVVIQKQCKQKLFSTLNWKPF